MSQATVLVVDDNPTKRYLLVSWLSRAGFAIREAETGSEALRLLSGSRVDLVVLDPYAVEGGPDRDRSELGRLVVCQCTSEAPEGRPNGRDDHGSRHSEQRNNGHPVGRLALP